MKTDRFSDIIRRKLESIRPEFTDKDWTRMQASLQQAMPPQPGSPTTGTPFSGGVWSGSPWLLAAASVSTVVLIAFSLWQRSEINTLRETVGQLKQQSVATQPAPASITPNRSALSTLDSQYRSQPAPQAESDIQANQPLPGNQDTVASTGSDALLNSGRQETTDERATNKWIALLNNAMLLRTERRFRSVTHVPKLNQARTSKQIDMVLPLLL